MIFFPLAVAVAEEPAGTVPQDTNTVQETVQSEPTSTKDPDIIALEQRLLGEYQSTSTDSSVPYESSNFGGSISGIVLLLVMLGFIFWAKKKQSAQITPGDIRLVSKIPLGREGALAIVAIGQQNGPRKMLVGLSDHSAPSFLTFIDDDSEVEVPPQSPQSTPIPYNMSLDKSSSSKPAKKDVEEGGFDAFLQKMENQPSRETEVQLPSRSDLVNQVLQARGLEPTASHSADIEFDEDSQDDPWLLEFRKKSQR